MKKNNIGFTILITIVATIGGFLFGYDSGVINGTVDGLQHAFGSNSVGTGFNVASMLLGCAVGAFAAGQLADKFGRRTILFIAAVLFAISAFGSGIATGSLEFVIYRLIGGLAVGASSILAPAYISEVAPAQYRGMLSSVQQISILIGVFFSFLSNWLIARAAGGSLEPFILDFAAWRWMFWIEILPAIAFFFFLFFIPESPRFLVASGRKNQAIKVLTKLMGNSAKSKYNEIQHSLSSHHKASLKDVIGPAGFRPIVWIGIGLAFFQQAVGINVVFYYGAVLWQSAGFSEDQSLLTNVIGAIISIAGGVVTLLTIERIGRKKLLMSGSLGMFIAMGILAFVFFTNSENAEGNIVLNRISSVIALLGINLFLFFFNLSWGPVMWVMLGEMFPNRMRGSGLAVSGFAQWTFNFGVTMSFPIIMIALGLGPAFILYSSFAFVSFFFVKKWVVETKGIELEDMKG